MVEVGVCSDGGVLWWRWVMEVGGVVMEVGVCGDGDIHNMIDYESLEIS